ncbi:MAG: SUMF1/EgtB/PvdO family nonheme iron enzyme [Armatimonadetes bacterium]|nr:SUMF1/EgtB/PvdO family nonheme iron enzyme [Armatimonadota bacterium]
MKERIAERMAIARKRTLDLLDLVPDEFLRQRVHDFYSPVGWHFGHIGMTEEHWTVVRAMGQAPMDEALSFRFANLPENPKDDRTQIPDRAAIVEYLRQTRERSLSLLADARLDDAQPLLRDGYAWEFALQHEMQHQESILELLCLIHQAIGAPCSEPGMEWRSGVEHSWITVPEGETEFGSRDSFAYDNERPAFVARIDEFQISRLPVTNYDWTLFMADSGHRRPEYWLDGDGWFAYSPSGPRPLHPDEPVMGISWYDAEAYARWASARLPTEFEWERAAHGADNEPASAFGLLEGAGGAWEWTSSKFLPYEGFVAYPYDGYSKEHMDGSCYVCRGGSWATARPILRCSFRNWYVPTYRQGFLGLRLAR